MIVSRDSMDNEEKKQGRFNVSRRNFLKLSGAAAAVAAVGYAVKGSGVSSLATPYGADEPIVSDSWVATSCLNCPSRCATKVRVVKLSGAAHRNAVKVKGNPLSRANEGKTCPRANIGLQVLYDEARVAGPLKRQNATKGRGVDPQWGPVSWAEALTEVAGKMSDLRAAGNPHRLLVMQGLNARSDEDVILRFASAYGTPNAVSGDALDDEAAKSGAWMADGHYDHSAYDLGKTNYVLAFGADILESERPLARLMRMWAKMRRERPNRGKVVVISPRYSVTASKADEWIPIKPGTEGALAMAIAHVIISEGLYDSAFVNTYTAGFADYRNLALRNSNSPWAVAPVTGVDAETIQQMAREFAQTKPAIAWRGRTATAWPQGSYTSYAIFCLNALVGSIDAPGGIMYQEAPPYKAMPAVTEDATATTGKAKPRLDLSGTAQFPRAQVVTNQVASSIQAGTPYPVDMAIGFNCNFNMSAPGTARWDEALKKVPYYVHVAPFISEMAEYADIILPASTFLEQWAYDDSPPGSGFAEARIKQPVLDETVHDTRSVGDIVFSLASKLGGTVAQSFSNIGDDSEGFVQFRTSTLMSWADFQEKGVWVGPDYVYGKFGAIFNTPSGKFEFKSGNLEALYTTLGITPGTDAYLPHYEPAEFLGDGITYLLVLVPYQPLLTMESGIQNYPWAQQVFLVMHGMGWDNMVEINSETAAHLNIRDKDMVWVESAVGKIKAKARVFQGIHPGVVSISYGQGHYAVGKWQRGIGVNPNEILGVGYDAISGQAALFNTRVKIYRA